MLEHLCPGLRQHLTDDLAVRIREAAIQPVVANREPLVIYTELVEDGGVKAIDLSEADVTFKQSTCHTLNSCEHLTDHAAMDIGQATVQAIVVITEMIIVQTEEVENRGIELPDGGWLLHGPASKFICGTMAGSSLHPGSHHP